MEQSPSHADQRHEPDSGRVAVPEIAELLHLQRPAAMVAAAVVVLVGLVVALVLPGVLPPNAITGFAVGLLALFAAVAAAVVLDGRDPVVRGPRHLRRDGHSVLARMPGPDPVEHAAPVLQAVRRRLAERNHLSIAITGSGTDPSELAAALGRGAAAAGHTSLVVDLRAAGAPGVADVGAGTVRLGEAATLADDRPYAWIGAGADRAAAVTAAAGVARRPPRDLELLLVVAPEAATHTPELLRACDRTLLLVAADAQQRAMVSARLDALERAGGTPEAVVVGGLLVGTAGEQASATPERPAARGMGAAFGAASADRGAATIPPVDEAEEDRPTPFADAAGAEPAAAVDPGPVPSPLATPTPPPPPPPVLEDVGPVPFEEDEVDVFAAADGPTGDADDELAPQQAERVGGDEDAGAADVAAPTDAAAPIDELPLTDELAAPADATDADVGDDVLTADDVPPADEPTDADVDIDLTALDEPELDDTPDAAEHPDTDAPEAQQATDPDATGPLRPIAFRTTDGEAGLDGFAATDPLVTTAALEQLLRRHDDEA